MVGHGNDWDGRLPRPMVPQQPYRPPPRDGRQWEPPGFGMLRPMAPPHGPHHPQDGWGPPHHAPWPRQQHAAPPHQQPAQWPPQYRHEHAYGPGPALPLGLRPPGVLAPPRAPLPPPVVEHSARSSGSVTVFSSGPASSAARSLPPPVPDDPASPPPPPPPPPDSAPPPSNTQQEVQQAANARAPPLPPGSQPTGGAVAIDGKRAGAPGSSPVPSKPAAPLPPWLANSAEKRAAAATTAEAAAAKTASGPSTAMPDTPASPPKSPPRSGPPAVDVSTLRIPAATSPGRKQFRFPSAAAPKAIAGNRPLFLQKGSSPTTSGSTGAPDSAPAVGVKSRLSMNTAAAAMSNLGGVFEQPDAAAQRAMKVDTARQPNAADAAPDGLKKRRRWDVSAGSAAAVQAEGPQASNGSKPLTREAADSAARSAPDGGAAGGRRRDARTRSSSTTSSTSRSSRSSSRSSSNDGRRRRRRRTSSRSSSSRSSGSRSSSTTSGGSGGQRRRYPSRRRASTPDSPRRRRRSGDSRTPPYRRGTGSRGRSPSPIPKAPPSRIRGVSPPRGKAEHRSSGHAQSLQRMREAERRERLQQQEADRARRRKDADIRPRRRASPASPGPARAERRSRDDRVRRRHDRAADERRPSNSYRDRRASRDRARDDDRDRSAHHRSSRQTLDHRGRSASPRDYDASRRRHGSPERERRPNERRELLRSSRHGSRPGSPKPSHWRRSSPEHEDERKRVQVTQLDAKVEKQVHQLAESFHVDLDSLEGHADGDPLWNWVHNTFFGPTREQSYLDNWDGELNDMVNALQEQANVHLPFDDPAFTAAAAADMLAEEAASARDDRPPLRELSPYVSRSDELQGLWEVPDGTSPPPDPRLHEADGDGPLMDGTGLALPLPRWVTVVERQAAQSVYLEHARAVATAAAAAALAPPPGPPPDPEAEGPAADSDSGVSWAEQEHGRDADDYAESSPHGGSGEHHPPAAPRHEARMADDTADAQQLTLEQMAAQAWVPQAQPQPPQEEPAGWNGPRSQAIQQYDPEDGEQWACVESDGHVSRDRHKYSLEDLRHYAQQGRWGLALGAAVARYENKHRRVWVPLTQEPLSADDLRWGGAVAVPSAAELAEHRAAAAAALRPTDSGFCAAQSTAYLDALQGGASLGAQLEALAAQPLPPDTDTGAFGSDPGTAAAGASRDPDPTIAVRAAAANQQAAWRNNLPIEQEVAAFEALNVEDEWRKHRACRIDATIQALDASWRQKEKAARLAAQKPLWGPPPPPTLTSTLSGELAVTLFSSATLAKQRLQMFRSGLRDLVAGEFGQLRQQGEAQRAAAARQLAEDQAKEKAARLQLEAEERALRDREAAERRARQERKAAEDAQIQEAIKQRVAEKAAAAAKKGPAQNGSAASGRPGQRPQQPQQQQRAAGSKAAGSSGRGDDQSRKRSRDAAAPALQESSDDEREKPAPVPAATTPRKQQAAARAQPAKRPRAATPAESSEADSEPAPASDAERPSGSGEEADSPEAGANGRRAQKRPAGKPAKGKCSGRGGRQKRQRREDDASESEQSEPASESEDADASDDGAAEEAGADSGSGSSSGSGSDDAGDSDFEADKRQPAKARGRAKPKAAPPKRQPKQAAARAEPAIGKASKPTQADAAAASAAEAPDSAAGPDAGIEVPVRVTGSLPESGAACLALLEGEMSGADRLAKLDAEQAHLLGAAPKRTLQRQGSSRKRGGSTGPDGADDGSGSDGEEDAEAVAAAKREAVEAQYWKQQVEGSLQQIHNKVLQFDDKECDQLFTRPVLKTTPGYYTLIRHPVSLKDIGREFGTAKKRVLWHSRRGLERYYANVSLMCDNCREYQRHVDDPSEDVLGYANKMQAFVKQQVDVAEKRIQDHVAAEMFSLGRGG